MKRLLFFAIAACMLFTSAFAEGNASFRYPFGITEDMTVDQAAEALKSIFGEPEEIYPSGSFSIDPAGIFFENLLVDHVYFQEFEDGNWRFSCRLIAIKDLSIFYCFENIYVLFKEQYGTATEVYPRIWAIDFDGIKVREVTFDGSGAIEGILTHSVADSIYFVWENKVELYFVKNDNYETGEVSYYAEIRCVK